MEFCPLRRLLSKATQNSKSETMQHLVLALLLIATTPELPSPGTTASISPAQQELLTDYGPATLKITPSNNRSSSLRVGEQFFEFKGATLYAVLQMTSGYMQPCPETPVDFGPVPDVLYEYEDHPFSCHEALYESVDLYASCSDCHLEELQDIVHTYLMRELWLVPAGGNIEEGGQELVNR